MYPCSSRKIIYYGKKVFITIIGTTSIRPPDVYMN